jgi:hypothetical protein
MIIKIEISSESGISESEIPDNGIPESGIPERALHIKPVKPELEGGWKAVTNALPARGRHAYVLAFCDTHLEGEGRPVVMPVARKSEGWDAVTHWMPLPSPPADCEIELVREIKGKALPGRDSEASVPRTKFGRKFIA